MTPEQSGPIFHRQIHVGSPQAAQEAANIIYQDVMTERAPILPETPPEPPKRITYRDLAKRFGVNVSTVIRKVASAKEFNPEILDQGPRPKIGSAITYSEEEVERLTPYILSDGRRNRWQTIINSKSDKTDGSGRQYWAQVEIISNPIYDPEKEKEELKKKERELKLKRRDLEFARSVLGFIAFDVVVHKGGEVFAKTERDPTKFYGEETQFIPQDPKCYIMDRFIRIVESLWNTQKGNSALEGQICAHCQTIKKHGIRLATVIAATCRHFRFQTPPEYIREESSVRRVPRPSQRDGSHPRLKF